MGTTGQCDRVDTLIGRLLPASSAIAKPASLLPHLARIAGLTELAFPEMRELERERTTRVEWQQFHRGRPVQDAFIRIDRDRVSGVVDVLIDTATDRPVPSAVRSIDSARALAVRALRSELCVDPGEPVEPCPSGATEITTEASDAPTLLLFGGVIRRVFTVRAAARDAAGEEWAVREYAIDAASDDPRPEVAIVRAKNPLHRYAPGQGRVFDPNPENTLNDTTLRPECVAADSAAYYDVELPDLDPPSGGSWTLSGRFAEVRDLRGVHALPPRRPADEIPPRFAYERGTPDFAAVMAYYHLDRLQRHTRSIGLPRLAGTPVAVDVHDRDADVPRSYYRDIPPGRGQIELWRRLPSEDLREDERNAVFAAEDADVIAHEYGHLLLARETNGVFSITGKYTTTSEAAEIGEGFGDYWAWSASDEATRASGFNEDCLAEWANGGKCYRTYSGMPSYTNWIPNAWEHVNGEIWSGTLVDVFRAIGDRDTSDWIILQGHLNRADAGDAPRMREMAEGMIVADAQKFEGRHRDLLCSVFCQHDVEPPVCCGADLCPVPEPTSAAR